MQTSRRFTIFSIVMLVLILLVGGATFYFFMNNIIRDDADSKLSKMLEIERIKLEMSVKGEIALVLKMADSPVLRRYFKQPENSELETLALEEIASYRRAFASHSTFWVNDKDKKFYYNDSYAYTIDTSDANNYWYAMTINDSKRFNFNINYNPNIKKTNLWINAAVYSEKTPIGMVGTGIDLPTFIDSIYRDSASVFALYFFNSNGEITSAKNTHLAASKKRIDYELGVTGVEILSKIKNIRNSEIVTFYSTIGEVAVTTIPSSDWYVAAIMPYTLDKPKTIITGLFLAMLVLILLIFVSSNFFIMKLQNPKSDAEEKY